MAQGRAAGGVHIGELAGEPHHSGVRRGRVGRALLAEVTARTPHVAVGRLEALDALVAPLAGVGGALRRRNPHDEPLQAHGQQRSRPDDCEQERRWLGGFLEHFQAINTPSGALQ